MRNQFQTCFGAPDKCLRAIIHLLIGAFLLAPFVGQGQTFTATPSVIGAGGGTSAGGAFSLTGTIGQSAVSASNGGAFSLESGFWSAFVVIQVEGAPRLSAVLSGGVITLSWPENPSGYQLESSASLSPGSADWSPMTQTPQLDGETLLISVPSTQGMTFFRLRRNPETDPCL